MSSLFQQSELRILISISFHILQEKSSNKANRIWSKGLKMPFWLRQHLGFGHFHGEIPIASRDSGLALWQWLWAGPGVRAEPPWLLRNQTEKSKRTKYLDFQKFRALCFLPEVSREMFIQDIKTLMEKAERHLQAADMESSKPAENESSFSHCTAARSQRAKSVQWFLCCYCQKHIEGFLEKSELRGRFETNTCSIWSTLITTTV